MSAIEFQAVTFSYDGPDPAAGAVQALSGLTVSIARGEFVAVLGKKGAGKSSFLRLCNGLLLPNNGVVLLDGMNPGNAGQIWKIRSRAGMVFQNPDSQIIGATVAEDVAFGPENLGLPPQVIGERVQDALQSTGLLVFRDSATTQLSPAQKVRLAVAGVLALEADCLLFDEAAAQLDPAERKETAALLRALNRDRGITVVQATADLDEAMAADRIIVLDGGKIALEGTPAQLLADIPGLKRWCEPPHQQRAPADQGKRGETGAAWQGIDSGHHLPGSFILHRLDARTKIASIGFFMCAVFFLKSLPALLLLLLATLALASRAGKPLRQSLRGLKLVLCLSLVAVVVNLFSVKGTPLLEAGMLRHLSREAVALSATMLLRILLLASAASLLTFTTSPLALANGLERLLKPLSWIGIRVSELAMMLLIALRFIPVIVKEAERLLAAHPARSAELHRASLLQRAQSYLPLFIPLFGAVARRGDALATAMEARCYRGGTGRTSMNPPVLRRADFACGAALVTILSVAVLWDKLPLP